jgi:hypothetical protein
MSGARLKVHARSVGWPSATRISRSPGRRRHRRLRGPDEDRRGGFEHGGGWAMGRFDNEAMTFVNELYQRAVAFLFG